MSANINAAEGPRWCVIGRNQTRDLKTGELVERIAAVDIAADGSSADPELIKTNELPDYIGQREAAGAPRWVWSDTASWYPQLLEVGVQIERCHDLRLCHAILKRSERVSARTALIAATMWDAGSGATFGANTTNSGSKDSALFEMEARPERSAEVPHDLEAALVEFGRQRTALASADEPARVGLLLAAESAGALIATEMTSAGVPWDAVEHDRLLSEVLGPRPTGDAKPAKLQGLALEIRAALGDSEASLDSSPKLIRALRAAGVEVSSTSHWELEKYGHPAIEPLLSYKKLSRLLSANGWTWIDEWVRHGRYRPLYVPGGVVTGRWASSGGGALQLPRQLRPALRADPGWMLVSADVAQLEPRVLAAMAGDQTMAEAGHGKDLYSGIVASGIVATRQEAKIAVLGAMYGATTGDSGRLVPRLRRSFPAAMRLVDGAAAVGERGGVVSTWLGRSSHEPDQEWSELQSLASLPGATTRDEDRARRTAREFGRFTRNFVVQGTAAEWALTWLAELRRRLVCLEPLSGGALATASGPTFERRPHLVFFLHDEVIVHTPEEHAEAVGVAVTEAAERAGQLLFGNSTVEFPLELRIAERAAKS